MRTAWLLLAVLALATAGCRGGTKAGGQRHDETVVLSIASHDFGDRDLAEYLAAVNRLSHGSIGLALKEGWRAGEVDSDRGTVADVRAGKVDLAKVAVGSLDTLGVKDFEAVMAPFLVDSVGLEKKLLTSDLPSQMLVGVDRLGVSGVAVLAGEPRRPFGLTRRLLDAADYRDAVIAVSPSLVSARTFRALGATTRGYLARALPPWEFDGAELDLLTVERNQYDGPGTSLTANVAFWPRAFVVVANRDALAKLTPNQRDALVEAGRDAVGAEIARLRTEDRDQAAILCRRGLAVVQATPADIATLRAAVRVVYAQLARDPQTRSFIQAIEALKRRAPAPEPSQCPRQRIRRKRVRGELPTRKNVATPLDGTWEMKATRAQVVAVTHSPFDPSADAGRYRLVLRRGRTYGYHLDVPRSSDSGVFSVQGDVIRFKWKDELAVYRWNVYRDTLTLRFLPGRAQGAPNLTFAPWHRVAR
jgi:TRAP-type C4-dicarboxylate transport system substrate-binding protein